LNNHDTNVSNQHALSKFVPLQTIDSSLPARKSMNPSNSRGKFNNTMSYSGRKSGVRAPRQMRETIGISSGNEIRPSTMSAATNIVGHQ